MIWKIYVFALLQKSTNRVGKKMFPISFLSGQSLEYIESLGKTAVLTCLKSTVVNEIIYLNKFFVLYRIPMKRPPCPV